MELLVVVLIIGILLSLGLPLYLAAIADAKEKTCLANLRMIKTSAQAYRIKHGSYTTNLDDLKPDLQVIPSCPSGGNFSVTGDDTNGPAAYCDVHAPE